MLVNNPLFTNAPVTLSKPWFWRVPLLEKPAGMLTVPLLLFAKDEELGKVILLLRFSVPRLVSAVAPEKPRFSPLGNVVVAPAVVVNELGPAGKLMPLLHVEVLVTVSELEEVLFPALGVAAQAVPEWVMVKAPS